MRIKNKTVLRKWIKNSIGTTGELKVLWIFDDGTWEIVYPGQFLPGMKGYKIRRFLIPPTRELACKKCLDKVITWNFHEVEKELSERSDEK